MLRLLFSSASTAGNIVRSINWMPFSAIKVATGCWIGIGGFEKRRGWQPFCQ